MMNRTVRCNLPQSVGFVTLSLAACCCKPLLAHSLLLRKAAIAVSAHYVTLAASTVA